MNAFRQFGIIEIARTGPTALAHGSKTTVPGERPAYTGEATTTADADRERNGTTQAELDETTATDTTTQTAESEDTR